MTLKTSRIARKGSRRCSKTELATIRSYTPAVYGRVPCYTGRLPCRGGYHAGKRAMLGWCSPNSRTEDIVCASALYSRVDEREGRLGETHCSGRFWALPNGFAYTITSTSLQRELKIEPPYQPSQSKQRPADDRAERT